MAKVLRQFEIKSHVHDHVNYWENQLRYTRHFPHENILVTFYDAISNEPNQVLNGVLYELGIEAKKNEEVGKKVNASREEIIPDEVYAYLLEKYRPLYQQLHRHIGGYATEWLKKHYSREVDHRVNTAPQSLICASTLL